MAELIALGKSLDLPPSFVLRMVRNNSLLLDEVVEGDYSYPIQLPATPRNRKFFQFLDMPDTLQNTNIIPCEYIEHGLVIVRGNLYAKKANENQYECFILSALSSLAEIKDELIGTLYYGGLRQIDGEHQISSYFLTAPDGLGQVKFSFNNGVTANITVTWTTDANTTLNLIRDEILLLAPSLYPGLTISVAVVGNKITIEGEWPGGYPLLRAVPVTGSWSLDVVNRGPVVTARVLRDHMEAVMAAPDDHDYLFVPVQIFDHNLFNWAVIGAPFDIVWCNYYYLGGFKPYLEAPPFGDYGWTVRHPVSPYPKAIYVLSEIIKAGGYHPKGTIFDDPEIMNLLIFTNHCLHKADFSSFLKEDQFQLNFRVGDLLPKVTINHYLKAMRKLFGIHFFFNDTRRECYIEFLDDIVSSTDFIHWNSKVASKPVVSVAEPEGFTLKFDLDTEDLFIEELVPEIDAFNRLPDVADNPGVVTGESQDIVFSKKRKTFYKANYSSGGSFLGWLFHSLGFHPLKIGEGNHEVDAGAGPLTQFRDVIHPPGGPYIVSTPQIKQKLNQINDPEGYHPFKLRFMFYRGMQETSTPGITYPMANWDNRDVDGNMIPGQNYVLAWEGDNSLYENFWKRYLTWRDQAKEVEFLIDLSPLDYVNLDMRKKVQINGVNYFIKRIDVAFPIKAPARVTLLKC